MPEPARHYELAFDRYLRDRRVPHVCVDEARRLLLPTGDATANLKFFDYVIYGENENLLVELKGRRLVPTRAGTASRLECWATEDDLTSLQRWEALFGPPFAAVIVFVYWCDAQPEGALFEEVFESAGRWYAPRVVHVREYAACMRTRSPRWRTVDLAQADFDRISRPFVPPSTPTPSLASATEPSPHPR